MRKLKLTVLLILMICAGALNATAQQNTIWMYCYVDASASMPQKIGEDKHEGRFYVTGLISISVGQYQNLNPNRNSTKYFENACVDYFEKTVVKAAGSRGEEIEESGLSGLITNIDGPDVNSSSGYELGTKEEVEKDRAERIESNQESHRKIITFGWNPASRNAAIILKQPDYSLSGMH